MSHLTDRYGFRGCWLIVVGAIWVVFGFGLLLEGETPAPWTFHQEIPLWVRTGLWCSTGAVSILVGLRGKGGNDTAGHIALWIMPAERMLSFLGAWLMWVIAEALCLVGLDLGSIGYSNGWYPALIWAVIITMLRLVAGWQNPSGPPMPSVAEVRRDG